MAHLLHYVIFHGNITVITKASSIYFIKCKRKHINWANWSDLFTVAHRFSHYEQEISNSEWNKHCSHTDIHETMNKYAYESIVTQMEKESRRMDCQQGEKAEQQSSESIRTILDLSPLSFPFSLHPPPFLLTRIIFLFRCNLPPSSLSFFSFFICLSVSLCQLTLGGISVAGPHPSQTTACMVPCSVQSSALQFCHNEH